MSANPNIQVCLLAGHNKRGPEVLAYVTNMKPGHHVVLTRDPNNRFDKNAVEVRAMDAESETLIMIGFIAKAHNRRVAAWMDAHGGDYTGPALETVFGYAGTGKSKVPAIQITFPAEGGAA
jgi:HIRAN domain